VVLDHDGIHRAGSPDQCPITEIARAELADHIPTLDDLYDACGTDFDLAIDVKGDGAGEVISRVAASRGVAGRLWLFTERTAEHGSVAAAHRGVSVRGEDLQEPATRRALLRSLQEQDVEVVNARWPWWRRAAVQDVHAAGMLAFAWDVQWSVAVWRCRHLRIDGIFSDHVRLLRSSSK
jgi:glycerophosphoryl diester phosphodiesterase